MIRLKNIFLAQALAFSAVAFGQGTFATNNYPQTYDNRPSSTIKDFSSPEKLMSAKELVDININSMMNDAVLRNAIW